MTDNTKNTPYSDAPDLHEPKAEQEVESMAVEGTDDPTENAAEANLEAETSDLEAQLTDARAQIEKEKKEYLFLMAEFDNYRKRVVREKADLVKNASEKVLQGLLAIVDDFERGLEASKNTDSADAIREGMELIYNKFVKYLEANGVKAMASTGAAFDPDIHEAIASVPAPSPEMKGKIIDTTQKGYTLNDKVLRHAKVVVGE